MTDISENLDYQQLQNSKTY